ncbi:hypothetical protein [Sphingopyxis macrogoltabida]|uniref:Uncharacterized protein n=1 Tax=Sphingopyxis macrogoltabida TaxID=33050 RepID=A0A0N9U772_SPHMC|nr:hypothetical protein [Sphingopyxis macrogoltabida]ALH79004.1 hypothetical protein AN936_01025 [Sphingopyxis macrogoltabida]
MLFTTLLLAAMAPSPTAAVDTTRVAFTKCLNTAMKKGLDDKITAAEFEMAVKSVCETERAAFRTAVIALNRSGGDSEADAAENADMQVDDYHANFVDKFKDYSENNSRPGD